MTPSSSTTLSSRQTLQLRHQLTCAGVTLQSATYDTIRHHVLSYDLSTLSPHTLRLFSLRRELKSTRLFDDANPPPPPVLSALHKQGSAHHIPNHSTNDSTSGSTVPVVVSLSLEYSATCDVFICVYSAQSVSVARAKSKRTTLGDHAVYNVLFLEPATLNKLIQYPGPPSHRLQCVHFDSGSSRLLLAIHRRQNGDASASSTSTTSNINGVYPPQSNQGLRREYLDGNDSLELRGGVDADNDSDVADPDLRVQEPVHEPMLNHVDILQISKREFKAATKSEDDSTDGDAVALQRRLMLCVEKVGLSLLHAETIDVVCSADRVTRIFGVGRRSPSWRRAEGGSFLVEWRLSAERKLEMIQRVVVHDAVSAIAVSPCSKWLFAGHESGAVRVWDIGQGATESKELPRTYALGSSPLEAATADWHGSPVSSIRIFCGSKDSEPHRSDADCVIAWSTSMEVMIVTAARGSGVAKHWRFRVEIERTTVAQNDVVAGIDLVGVYSSDAGATERQGNSAHSHQNKKSLVESVLTAIPLCVTIDMGGFEERLLLVLRADVIHVLKVQAVVRVLQRTSHGDEISVLRVAGRRLVVLSGALSSSLRLLDPDSGSAKHASCDAPPTTLRSATISAIDCFSTDSKRSFVVLGWSGGGVVEVRSLETNTRVLMLQDPWLSACVTAISVVVQIIEPSNALRSVPDGASLQGLEPTAVRTNWGGLLRSTAATAPGARNANHLDAALAPAKLKNNTLSAPSAFVLAGTECGHIFGWKLPTDFDRGAPNAGERLVLEAKFRVDSAHSAHVVQLAALPTRAGHAACVASLGADGMVKVWAVPSLTLLGYANIATERHMAMPSCMAFVFRSDREQPNAHYLAVGFEDGVLAAWSLDQSRMSFAEVPVASQHERRLTRIAPLAQSRECGADFVTSSLDMTAIMWAITDGCVEERRYFDIGAPVVDVCTLGNDAFAALSNEVCALELCRRRDDSSVESKTLPLSSLDDDRVAPECDDDKSNDATGDEPASHVDMLTVDSVASAAELADAAQLLHHLSSDTGRRRDLLHGTGPVGGNESDTLGTVRTTTLRLEIGAPVVDVSLPDRLSTEEDGDGRYDGAGSIRATGSHTSTRTATVDSNTRVKDLLPDTVEDQQVRRFTPPARTKQRRKLSVAESIGPKVRDELPDDSLVRRLRLSRCFQRHWSRGFCWCGIGSELRASWVEPTGDARKPTCANCHLRIHTLTLKKTGYKPHFSLRAVLGIVVDVYRTLLAPSHALLFTSASSSRSPSSSRVSLHSALFRVFTAKFGMQSVVEEKLKLFLVSATHFVRDFDAVAVFGELLAMFAGDEPSDDEQAPDEMVALGVCCYAWFFSRAMVTNGELMTGSGHGKRQQYHECAADIEKGRSACWQFVRLDNALVCAQEMLVYPLVSPGYLRNILRYAGEYAQATPSRPTAAGDEGDDTGESYRPEAKWIEIHRFLRLLVGEWKQQNREFRLAEHTLFVQPLTTASAPSDVAERRAGVVEKLRLILSCFIFYDHNREGVMTLPDFTNVLRKLRYLWPNENVSEDEAESDTSRQLSLTFENTVLAAKRRFADLDSDGQLCYLDFWAMLYVVGVRTLSLLKFRDIPSFCKDYKLEIAPALQDILLCYMERSSTTVLPRGFQFGKSSLDQRAAAQHQRRVQGLHDGLFAMPTERTTTPSLSIQELLSMGDLTSERVNPKDQIYLEGSAPALSESASVTAMDRFRPLARDREGQTAHGVPPVVLGVRETGPRDKKRAFLSVSAMAADTLPKRAGDKFRPVPTSTVQVLHLDTPPHQSSTNAELKSTKPPAFSSTYVQFPFVRPRQRRVEMATRAIAGAKDRHTAASHGEVDWPAKIIQEHEEDELASQQAVVYPSRFSISSIAELPRPQPVRHDSFQESKAGAHLLARGDSLKQQRDKKYALAATVPAPPASVPLGAKQPVVLESPLEQSALSPVASEPRPPVKRKKDKTAVVVIPNVEKEPTHRSQALGTESVNAVSASLAKRPDPPPERLQVPDTKLLPLQQMNVVAEIEAVAAILPENDQVSRAVESTSTAFTKERWTTEAHSEVEEPQRAEPAEALARPPAPAQAAVAIVSAPSFAHPAGDTVTLLHELSDTLQGDKQPVATTDAHEAEDVSTNRLLGSAGAEVEGIDDRGRGESGAGKGSDCDFVGVSVKPDLHHETRVEQTSTAAVIHSPGPKQEAPSTQQNQNVVSSPPLHESLPDTKSSVPSPVSTVAESSSRAADVTVESSLRLAGVTEQTLKGGVFHHLFRFSQQPAFRSSATVFNNPLRSSQWDPSDGSDSDSDDGRQAAKRSAQEPVVDEAEESDGLDDIELQLTPEALQAHRTAFGPRHRRHGMHEPHAPSLQHFGLAVSAVRQLSRVPSRRDVLRDASGTVERRQTKLEASVSQEESSPSATSPNEHVLARDVLALDVAFSPEAEERMQHKWLAFFRNAEAAMFSPLKQELHDRDEAQRAHEEKQSRLMKKREEQQVQDTLRLQQSRRESATTTTTKALVRGGGTSRVELTAPCAVADSANFRLRRMARESCQEVQRELRFGESLAGALASASEAQYFVFQYTPSTHGSILTLRLHAECGGAEVFMSTETTAPCVSDFMWRSVDKAKGLGEGDGQKLVLYTHDLARVTTNAVEGAGGEEERSRICFYFSVVASEPNTKFAVSIMASGQTMEPSQAVALVDTLIRQFNALSKSLQSHTPPHRIDSSLAPSLSASPSTAASASQFFHRQRKELTGGRRVDPRSTSSSETLKPAHLLGADGNTDGAEEEEGNGDSDSFQYLLESVSEKRGFGARKAKSFFLTGPTNDQFAFIQDEVANLEDAMARYSPERGRGYSTTASADDTLLGSSKQDAIFVIAAGKRHSLQLSSPERITGRRRSANGTRRRLSPIKGAVSDAPAPLASKPASTALQVAKFAPKPVAYSLSSLDHSNHLRVSKSSSTPHLPSRQTVLPHVRSVSLLK